MSGGWSVTVILIVTAITDWRCQALPGWMIAAAGIGGIGRALTADWGIRQWNVWMISSIVLLVFCRMTRQALGYGDGLMWGVTGLYLGIWGNVKLWITALFFSFWFSILLLIFKRTSIRERFPFLPFLLTAHLLQLVTGG